MLFPITIFPCVPFAPDIFLINQFAETESTCPWDSVHPQMILPPTLWPETPEHLGCSLSSFLRALSYRMMTVWAGLQTRCAMTWSTQTQSLWAPGRVCKYSVNSCPASLHRSPPLERGGKKTGRLHNFHFQIPRTRATPLLYMG